MTVAVRPRTPWEGIDLGFAMARRWFLPLWRLWWLPVLPMALLLVILFPDSPFLVMVLLWWGKPLYEALLLFSLSRALFDEHPSLSAMLRQWRVPLRSGLIGNLTWRRFSPNRSFYMPVAVLEQLQGKPRRARIAVLGRRQHAGLWLTLVGYHFELALQFSALVLVLIMLPEELDWLAWDDLFVDASEFGSWLGVCVDLLVMSLIAPFYVAGGFALYLTRRSELEAWDIEISFRRLMARRGNARCPMAAALAGLVLLGGGVLMPGESPLQAADLQSEEARRIITEVLADEDFGRTEWVPSWKYVGEERAQAEEPPEGLAEFLEFLLDGFLGFFKGIAEVAEVLLWALVGVLIGYLAYRIGLNRGWLQMGVLAKPRAQEAPVSLFGLDLSPDSLPQDIGGEALGLLRADQPRAALSLLYRGTLAALLQQQRLEIPPSATEGECLTLVTAVRPEPEAALFRRLTGAWLRLAYGHLLPPGGEVEALCRDWQRVYRSAHES
jgi:hypothetical protein